MSKYIDAELLRVKLERCLKNIRDYMNGAGMKFKGPKYYKAKGKESAYDTILGVLASLQQEQPDADLDKEIEMYISAKRLRDYAFLVLSIARHFAEWGAIHLNARKEE